MNEEEVLGSIDYIATKQGLSGLWVQTNSEAVVAFIGEDKRDMDLGGYRLAFQDYAGELQFVEWGDSLERKASGLHLITRR